MPNAQFMAALHASTKALREMARDDATYDFVYAHKNMFVGNREAFKAAVAACQERSGRELLDKLDPQEICIEKVTEAELLHSCYSARQQTRRHRYGNLRRQQARHCRH